MSEKIKAEWVLINTVGIRGFSSDELGKGMAVKAVCLTCFDEARAYIKQNVKEQSTILAFGSFNVLEQACTSIGADRMC